MAPLSLLAALAASSFFKDVLSMDIAFVDGPDCKGIGLYGTKSIPHLPCYDLSSLDPAESVHMRNMTEGQVLHFFSDTSCQIALHTSSGIEDQCFTSPHGKFGSFQVSASDTGVSTLKRDATTTDIEPYTVKMSNYTAMGTFEPAKIDLGLSIFTIGLAIYGAGQAISLYGAINTCIATKGPNPSAKSIFDCAIQPVGTIFSLAGTTLIHIAGKRVARRLQLAQGNVVELRKRAEMIDGANADFVHSIMNTTTDGSVLHVGSAERNMSTGTHTSPIYEVNFGNGGLWHYSSFYESEHDDFVHHMRPAYETPIDKRSAPNPYNTIRWGSGGFDFAYCDYNKNAPASGFSNRNKQQIYDIVYDQLTCRDSASTYGNAGSLGIDMRNEAGTIVGELEIRPYSGSNRPAPRSCTSQSYTVDSDCNIS